MEAVNPSLERTSGELGEEFLDWWRSGEKRGMGEDKLRRRRGVEDNALQVISGNYLTPLPRYIYIRDPTLCWRISDT